MERSSVFAPPEQADPDLPRHHASPRSRPPVVERIAGWSARHRKTAVLGWLFLVAARSSSAARCSPPRTSRVYDAGQSGQAERTLNGLNVPSPPAESVLIQARHRAGRSRPTPRCGRRRGRSPRPCAACRRSAADIRSPLSPGAASLLSASGRSALVKFSIPGNSGNEDQTVTSDLNAVAAVQNRHPDLLIQEAGDASGDRAISALVSADFRKAEVTSVPITLILLIGVFGALIAAGIPLLLAATAVMTAISLLAIPGHWLPVGQSTSEVVLLIGMAVGIDYSLFYLRREREERAKGAESARHCGSPRGRRAGRS